MADSQTNKNIKWPIIKCPYCGYEYTPADIFYPGELIGVPQQVVRDALGKIIYQEYDDDELPGQVEHYICDECGKAFVVEPVITYKVRKEDEALDFTTQEASLLD